MKKSSYYIAPVGDWTHDLPYTVASNMVKVSHALNHSATTAVTHRICSEFKLYVVFVSVTMTTQCKSDASMFCDKKWNYFMSSNQFRWDLDGKLLTKLAYE